MSIYRSFSPCDFILSPEKKKIFDLVASAPFLNQICFESAETELVRDTRRPILKARECVVAKQWLWEKEGGCAFMKNSQRGATTLFQPWLVVEKEFLSDKLSTRFVIFSLEQLR